MPLLRRLWKKREGMTALEVVMTTAVCVPAAAVLYLMGERVLDAFLFLLANAVGSPYM
jgi:hypothetical protein